MAAGDPYFNCDNGNISLNQALRLMVKKDSNENPFFSTNKQPEIYISPLILEWYESLIIKPSEELLVSLNNLVDGLNEDGIYSEFDLFHVMSGLETDEQRMRPLFTRSATKTFTAVSSPILNQYGIKSGGPGSYIDTNFNALNNSLKATFTNASFGIYIYDNVNETSVDAGYLQNSPYNETLIASRYTGFNQAFLSLASDAEAAFMSFDSRGLSSIKKTTGASITGWKNGAMQNNLAVNSSPFAPLNYFICGNNTDGSLTDRSTRTIQAIIVGSGIIDEIKLNNRLLQYNIERGTNF